MTDIYPTILAGGSDTRLWPLSCKSFPKQFVKLVGEESLFQSSSKRLAGTIDGISFENPLVLTNSDFRFVVVEQLQALGMDPGAVLIEPEGKKHRACRFGSCRAATLTWDNAKPVGKPRKLMESSYSHELGRDNEHSLKDGITTIYLDKQTSEAGPR